MNNLDALLNHPPSPLQTVEQKVFAFRGLRLLVKRDDLLHPHVSGNKWRKLKHNLLEARRLGLTKLITFGGAYSNHLAAVAAAGLEFGFSTLGVVGGEEIGLRNPTLGFAKECGMDLIFTSRANLRNKPENELLKLLKIDPAGAFVLPQGGANCLALPGCREIVEETTAQLGHLPDFFITACGTGATLAGISTGLRGSTAIGVSVLKGDFMQNEVEKLLTKCLPSQSAIPNPKSAIVVDDFHFGGYAKWKPELIDFINDFKEKTGIPLDPIYTGKAFFAAVELAEQGFFPEGASIVLVHTGGLQGIAGFNERFGNIVS
ncbi:MAG: 1-aminocyclopropane-1-carboxylate deaminase/D-cysteine desulfhydrase [Saprospiraceae bacterium]|nr:1-aminocyclopropane-1-carboxylate deaminase/D-cysteine desulfhydrase [Saprospiraceae bacterium]